MTSLFGPNWRTSVSGMMETLCIIIIAVCSLPSEIWANPKVWMPAVGLLVAKTVKDFLTKDKAVTGGTIQNDPSSVTVPGAKTVAVVLLGICIGLQGCATVPASTNAAVVKALETDAYNAVLQTATAYAGSAMAGQNGQDAALAAFEAAAIPNGAAAIGTLLTAYAGPEIAAVKATVQTEVAKLTSKGVPAKDALNTVGAALQTVANQSAK